MPVASPIPPTSRQRLSPHFLLSEFASGNGAAFPPAVVANLRRVAGMLEHLRKALGNPPLLITSGYRTLRWNQLVGGVSRSYHLQGLAADVIARVYSAFEVQRAALQLQERGLIGGIGLYPGFTHVDLGPKRTWASEEQRLARGGEPS